MAKPFSDTVNNTGLVQYCEQNIFGDTGFGQISSDTSRLQIITNYVNEAYNRYVSIAMKSDGKWQFDDSNYGDYPIAVTDLVANQSDYQFLVSMVDILSVEIQNAGSVWYTMTEIDEQELANDHISMSQRFKIASQPYAFNRTANSIFLLPAPNYSLTGGLKIKYQRPPSYFVYTDTSKTPGFAETQHEYLANYAIWKYMASKGMSPASAFAQMVQDAEQVGIPSLYYKREKDTTKRMYPKATYRR
jgi:hypothetical protein